MTDKEFGALAAATSYWLGEVGRGRDRFAQLNYDACVKQMQAALIERNRTENTDESVS
jgi:hypothetical protein